jgi:hypothetical protein
LIVNTLSSSLSRTRLIILLVIIKEDKMSVIVIKIAPLMTNDTCFVKQRSAADIDKNYRKKLPLSHFCTLNMKIRVSPCILSNAGM